jgi:dihydrofolate synthase/folylpolyglutamate synthase
MLNAIRFIDFNLQRLRSFFNSIHNIHNKLPNIIHVAGTNGKGSTVSFIRYILKAHGLTSNVFISPHLVNFNERIRINEKLISNDYLNEIIKKLEEIESFNTLSIFEKTFAIACVAFYNNSADFNIIEVGLGGRLDATNIIENPLISVITNIDYDHQDFLGRNVLGIAFEKACIIKRDSLVIKSKQTQDINNVFINYAKLLNSQLLLEDLDYKIIKGFLEYKNFKINLQKLGLIGEHQKTNAALACVASINAMLKNNINPKVELIEYGLQNTIWPARVQQVDNLYNFKVNEGSEIYLDGAHNPNGAEILVNFIESKAHKFKNIDIVFGMLVKKDLLGFLDHIVKLQNNLKDKAIFCKITIYPININNHISYTQQNILKECINLGLACETKDNIRDIFNKFKKNPNTRLVIICGSLYMLGDILRDNKIEIN